MISAPSAIGGEASDGSATLMSSARKVPPITQVRPGPEAAYGRGQLMLAGGFLVAGGACTLAALALPPLWSIVTAGTTQEVRLIGLHRTIWQLGLWLWALSAGLTMPGMLALASALSNPAAGTRARSTGTDPALRAAAGLFAAGSVLWLANIAFGASVAVSVANTVRGGGTIPGWFQPVQQWADALWQIGAPMLGLSLVLYGLIIRTGTAALPSWAGWLSVAAGAIVICFTPLGGTPPFLIYLLATLPLGAAALFRARTLPKQADRTVR